MAEGPSPSRRPHSASRNTTIRLRDIVDRTGADELMITSQIFELAARLRSDEITARVHKDLA